MFVRKRLMALLSIITLTASAIIPGNISYAEEEDEATKELRRKILEATYLLETEISQQYDNTIEMIKDMVTENSYDYPATMESFLEKKKPFSKMDYTGILAAVASVNAQLEKKGEQGIELTDIPFMSWKSSEESIKECLPVKVDEYTLRDDGKYEKTGYHFTSIPEEVGIYKETEEAGVFEKTGTETINPVEKERKYADIEFSVTDIRDIIRDAGFEPDDLEDDIARRKDALSKAISNEALNSSVFISIPSSITGNNEWIRRFLSAVGFVEDSPLVINGETIAGIASSLAGMIPYEWGGKASSPGYNSTWWLYDSKTGQQNGLDCSGFVQWVYMTAGFGPEITSKLISTDAILSSGLQEVAPEQLLPGDIGVIERSTTNHCGVYAGDGEWYHCSSYNNTVVKASYNFTKFYRVIPEDEEPLVRKIKITYPEIIDTVEKAIANINKHKENQNRQNSEDEILLHQDSEVLEASQEYEEEAEEVEEIEEIEENVEPWQPEETDEYLAEAEEPHEPESTVDTDADMTFSFNSEGLTQNEDDIYLLAQLIHHEANNQGLNGWIAVAEVVRNRMLSDSFPTALRDVIFQSGQFTKAKEIVDIKPRQELIDVARNVLSGTMSIFDNQNVLFFRNAGGNTDNWGPYRYYTSVGDHQFYLGKEN